MGTSSPTTRVAGGQRTISAGGMVQAAACTLDQEAERIAAGTANVLIEGEPGAGKRYYAMYIHAHSAWQNPEGFVELLPHMSEEELRVILFEDDRKRCEGMFGRPIPHLTARSTLFVHHIHEFSPINQSRIARFFIQAESGAGTSPLPGRVIMSTSLPWNVAVEQKLVAETLDRYLRQCERLVIPPLREHAGCIPKLVEHFLRQMEEEIGGPQLSVSDETMQRLQKHYWSDNVRELRALIEEAAFRAKGGVLEVPPEFFNEVERLGEAVRMIQAGKRLSLEELVGFLERTLLQRALVRWNFDIASTARVTGLTEKNLQYRIRKYEIYVPAARKRPPGG